MNDITAYFIGGPKHGDIDAVRSGNEIRIPMTSKDYYEAVRYTDMGHYGVASMPSMTIKQGRYVRQHELYGMPDAPGNRRNFLFMWQGAV